MALDFLAQQTFAGPAFPEPFVRFELEKELARLDLLPKRTGEEGRELQEGWESYRRKLRELVSQGGPIRVRNAVLDPLLRRLGYDRYENADEVTTREGREPGGTILANGTGRLRSWTLGLGEDIDAPSRRGHAYRYSPQRIAERVLLAAGERTGLLTNGLELRLLIVDPARNDSRIIFPLDPDWKRSRELPDGFPLLLALASPRGLKAVPELVEKARLQQTRVTKDLRRQAREAVERFLQEVLEHPANREVLAAAGDRTQLARALWHEGLVFIYRLLFILKLESHDDPAQAFGFASGSIWRNSFSPTTALARWVEPILRGGGTTGRLLEDGLRCLFRMCAAGVESTELVIKPVGGALFGDASTPWLSRLHWGERACAHLLDRLLWTAPGRGDQTRRRVHYGSLTVEDLGRVYEALLELEAGIAAEPMCRLRRQKLEVVVPAAQGERYRATAAVSPTDEDDAAGDTAADDAEEEASTRSGRTRVEWIEEIHADTFYLRVGLGRKASGSYYTPDSFVRFLVQETLGPQADVRSPKEDPSPAALLTLKILDPAMGSGHFLVQACRFVADRLYESCRRCDELALEEERRAESAKTERERAEAREKAAEWRRRVEALPDPDDELVKYLPSRAPEGEESGLSQRKAQALCRRLVAVHCLYGVDRNPLAVELAKLALWLESHAEGMPLTFLDHRLLVGDSLTGPFFEHLLTYPGTQQPLDDLFTQGLKERLSASLTDALRHVADLERSIGLDAADIVLKEQAKAALDRDLQPFRLLAAAWAGGVMLGPEGCDDLAYGRLAKAVADNTLAQQATDDTLGPQSGERAGVRGPLDELTQAHPPLAKMLSRGLGISSLPIEGEGSGGGGLAPVTTDAPIPARPNELAFPEVFFPTGKIEDRAGFHAVLGNPPWDAIQFKTKEFFAAFDFGILEAPTKRERTAIEERLKRNQQVAALFNAYTEAFEEQKRANDLLYKYQKVYIEGDLAGRQLDLFRVFMERNAQLLGESGITGVLVPSAFHANEGASGVRKLYLEDLSLRFCYSFENRRKLFEIDSRMKFAAVGASKPGPTIEFPCAFYVDDDEWLFADRGDRALRYTLDFVKRTGGEYLSLLELRSARDAEVAEVCFSGGEPFGKFCERVGIRFGSECHMTNDAWRFTPTEQILPGGEDPRDPDVAADLLRRGYLVLHEGKTFHQYTDHWADRPRYLVTTRQLEDKPDWLRASCFIRIAYREVASSTNERTMIAMLIPGFSVNGHKGPNERTPWVRGNCFALLVCGLLDSFPFDFLIRLSVSSSVTKFVLMACPLPPVFSSTRSDARRLMPDADNASASLPATFPTDMKRNAGTGHEERRGGAEGRSPSAERSEHDGGPQRQDPAACTGKGIAVSLNPESRLLIPLLVHSSLRLVANHAGYAPLWHDQLDDAWREKGASFTWPVLAADDERWAVRAAIDGVVADAYGLTREQYAHVLSTFSHRSYPKAPDLCLAAFDELRAIGLEAFTKKHDPYWDIPLNENLPKPVIELPGLETAAMAAEGPLFAYARSSGSPVSAPPTNAPTAAPSTLPATMPSRQPRQEGSNESAFTTLKALLAEKGVITSTDAQAATSLTAAEVRPLLKRLVEDGLATTEGQARGTRYRANEAL